MWIFNTDTNMWVKQSDALNKDDYNNIKQDIAKTQLYSRTLSGSTYLHTSNTDNIYEPLTYKNSNSWYVDPASSIYNTGGLPIYGEPINRDSINQYGKYLIEEGFSLKNLFTPTKGIDEMNTLSVNISTTESIDIANTKQVDGIKLQEGVLVLVKDQTTMVDLPFSTDPKSYFTGNYYLVSNNISDNTYYFYNSDNGIYQFINNSLTKVVSGTYSDINLSIYVNIGNVNADKQFRLSRNLNGYFPIDDEPHEFTSSHNYLVRHQVDYHNLFENSYYDIITHDSQSVSIDGFTYTIPSRTIYIGEFGVILNFQNTSTSQYVFNPFKSTLNCIVQTSDSYWMCGEEGTLLKMSKIDFSIAKIDLGEEFNTLNNISFLNDLRAIVVGKNNTIYYTYDGGYSWSKILFTQIDNFSYNKVIYYSIQKAFLAGDNGVFLELNYSDSILTKWSYNQINLAMNLTLTDYYDLIEDINDMYYMHFDNWGLSYSAGVDITHGAGINPSMECLFMVTNNNNIMVYEINNFITEHDVLYLSFNQKFGDITSVSNQKNTNNIIISGDNVISFNINTFQFLSTTSNLIIGSTYSVLYSGVNNKIYDYSGLNLFSVGNTPIVTNYSYGGNTYSTITSTPIIPKMLFMDYDMANKLNYFDSNYDYRLPNSLTFSGLTTSYLKVLKLQSSQYTWLDYIIDSYKIYPVNSDTSTGNFIKLNTQFTNGTSAYTFSNSVISTSFNDIKGMYPNVGSSTMSRWARFTPTLPISFSYSIFMYRYMSIFKLPFDFCSPGDMLQLTSNNVVANVMVNFGLTTSSVTGGIILTLSATTSSPGSHYHVNDIVQIDSGNNDALVKITGITGGNGATGGNILSINNIANGGSGYHVGETFSINWGGSTNALGTITGITGGSGAGILTYAPKISTPSTIYQGINYVVGQTFSVWGGIVPATGVVTAVSNIYFPTSPTINSGGSGWTAGDTYSIANSGFIGHVTTVTSAGVVTGISMVSTGPIYASSLPPNPFSVSGVGSGLKFNYSGYSYATNVAASFSITTFGAGYTTGVKLATSAGPGTGLEINVQSVSGTYSGAGSVASVSLTKPGTLYTSTTNAVTIATVGTGLQVDISASAIIPATLPGEVFSYTLISPGINYTPGLYTTTGLTSSGSGFSVPVLTTTSITASYTYFYAFNDLNQAILNSILANAVLTITNLNKFEDSSVLLSNFDFHPVSSGYDLAYDNINYTLTPLFNNSTAYKSLETSIITINDPSSVNSYSIKYPIVFNQFGYTPNYNLLNYLSNINSSFTASKKFYSMPEYSNLPCNGGGNFTDNNIYYDDNLSSTFLKNKLVFGNNLKFEYDTFWLNTFVDISATTVDISFITNTYNKTLLITKKYYDSDLGGWAIEFNDKILDVVDLDLISINIISRNTLEQISNDLGLFNNLNKPITTREFNSGAYFYSFYDNFIKTQINTDSYTKILLSDGDIKKYLTSIIHVDSNNKLAVNIINVNKTEEIIINNSYNMSSKLALNTSDLQDIDGSIQAFITFNGGAGSSNDINPSYIGIKNITKLDEFNILVDTTYLNLTSVTDIGNVKINIFDPFFNYKAIDLFDVGDDDMYKVPIKLNENNFQSNGFTNSLVNFKNNKNTFRLIDGLDINALAKQYHWILEAEISNAIIGLDTNGIVWYSGTWHSGRWFGGTWYSGTWLSGDWYAGNWYSYQITDKITSVIVGKNSVNNFNSIWENGRWLNGYWDAGTWMNGRRYAGIWNQGNWFNGIWNDGVWNDGIFSGGIWVQGTWNKGVFNSSNKPAYWIDGTFYSGDFQNGMWYNGNFGLSYSAVSKFGTLASNSRNAIWHGGVWSSGNFYSYENITSGTISASSIHKYSIWKTGIFNQGDFYGGIVYNMEFNNGVWHGGITQDVQIIGVDPTINQLTLNGVFRYNIGDYINVLNNGSTGSYLNLGNDYNPGKYRIASVEFDLTNDWTKLIIDYSFASLSFDPPYNATQSSDIDTGLKLVSKFKNIAWKSGIWYNGIFDGGSFLGGIWYGGVFMNGQWGV